MTYKTHIEIKSRVMDLLALQDLVPIPTIFLFYLVSLCIMAAVAPN